MAMRGDANGRAWLGAVGWVGAVAGSTDGELLERCRIGVGPERELAFESLVRRHGPLVLGRCRAILRDDHAADDAFQATFLILARRVEQVRDPDRLAPWLARVAQRVAHRARRNSARTQAREGRLAADAVRFEPGAGGRLGGDEVALVGAAIDGLDERDRRLVRLTYWQGKTYEEVAALLHWPIGTVRSRLHRARARLRGRLAGLSQTLGASTLHPLGWSGSLGGVDPSESLLRRTVRIASRSGSGASAAGGVSLTEVSKLVAQLVEGEGKMTQLRRWIVGGLVFGVVGSAGVASLAQRVAPPPGGSATSPPASAPKGATTLANSGFEDGDKAPKSWTKGRSVPGVEFVWASDQAHGGKRSLGFRKTADRYFPIAEWSQRMPREGQLPRLRVVGWVRADKAGKAVLDVQFQTADGTQTHAWAAYIGAKEANDPPATHDWKRYEGVVAIPDGTKEITIAPQMYGPGAVWFDDLSFEYTDAPAVDPTADDE